jgi:hypothetical protein
MTFDWRSRAFSYFQLLSNLCQFANQTVEEAIRRLLTEPFVTSTTMSERDFGLQINATLAEFIRSTEISFNLFIETTRLLIQVDQPFFGAIYHSLDQVDPNLFLTPLETDDDQIAGVCDLSNDPRQIPFLLI